MINNWLIANRSTGKAGDGGRSVLGETMQPGRRRPQPDEDDDLLPDAAGGDVPAAAEPARPALRRLVSGSLRSPTIMPRHSADAERSIGRRSHGTELTSRRVILME